MKKKISLSTIELDENAEIINEFLSKKGLSVIKGGIDWGNSNYSESTYVKKAVSKLAEISKFEVCAAEISSEETRNLIDFSSNF
jgi:hypothetical protein